MASETAASWTLPESLQELAECGEKEMVAEVLTLFRSDTVSRIQVLRTAVEAGDRVLTRAQAHSLKGSAVQVGAMALAEACRELELTAETRPDLFSPLAEIESQFDAVSRVIALEY